jgi:pSer/pThr/pTyr-binding forkhead associated (FHA) protein
MKLIIEDDEGQKRVFPIASDEVTIGRHEGNTIRLSERNVSRRHARFVRQNGHVLVEDLGSYNGVRVNGHKVVGQAPVHEGDLIQIGDYDLAIEAEPQSQAAAPTLPEIPVASGGEEKTESVSLEAALAEMDPEHLVATMEPVSEAKGPAGPVQDIAPEQAPRLWIVNTDLMGREFACIRTDLSIGQSNDCDISIAHPSVSPRHARLWRDAEGTWQLAQGQSVTPLKKGDSFTLGEVQLQFLEAADVRPTGRAQSRRWGAPIIATAFACVAAWAGWHLAPAVMSWRRGPQAGVDATPEARVAAEMGEVEIPPAPGQQAEPTPSTPEEKLSSARTAFDEHRFESALTVLTGLSSAEAEELRRQVHLEMAAEQAIFQAQIDLAAGRHRKAAEALGAAQGTLSFAKEYTQIKNALDEALARDKAAPKSRDTEGQTHEATAKKYYDEGVALMRKSQLREAQASFTRCLNADPNYARCYVLLGSTLAKIGRTDEAAKYYRIFVRMAPGDPSSAKVREYLDNYEASKK